MHIFNIFLKELRPFLILLFFVFVSLTRAEQSPVYLAVDATLTTETVSVIPEGYRAVSLEQFQRLTGYAGAMPDLSSTLTSQTLEQTYVPLAWMCMQVGFGVEAMEAERCVRILTSDAAPSTGAFLLLHGAALSARSIVRQIASRDVELRLVGANTKLLPEAFALGTGGKTFLPLEATAKAMDWKVDTRLTTSVTLVQADPSRPVMLRRDAQPLRSRQFLLWQSEPVIELDGVLYLEAGRFAELTGSRLTLLDNPSAVHLLAREALASPVDVFAEGPVLAEAQENMRRQGGKIFKTAWLTFDDGPSAIVTPMVLDILDRYGVKATFFILGKEAARRPETLKRIVESGHAVGNHTWTHDAKKLYGSPEGFFEEIEKTGTFLQETTGEEVRLVRAPYGPWGNFKPGHYSGLESRGLRLVNWNVDSGDSKSLSVKAGEIVAEVARAAERHTEMVILMHDSATKRETAAALPQIIELLQEKGFDLLPLDADTVVHAKGVLR